MSEDPFMTIDAYLGHVREHLPESMADEVIAELRGYMIEMAEDLSDGTVSSASAKKVVARFGAPSEIAREYILSTSDSTETVTGTHRFQQQPEEDMQQQQRDLFPAGYASTFFKFITIAVLWLLISWTVVTPFAYWWTASVVMFVPAIQFGVITSVFVAILLRSKTRGTQLRNVMYWNWSSLQKLFTFPENLALEVYRTRVLVDIGLTTLTVFGFVILGGYSHAGFVMFFAAPTMLFLIAHLAYAVRRFGNSDPVSFIRREFAVNIVLLLFLNLVIAWGFYPWSGSYPWGPLNYVNPFLVWTSVGYSTLILYQIVIRAQDLWWEGGRIPDDYSAKTQSLSPDAKRKLLNRTKRTALRTIGGITASFSAIIVIGLFVLFFTHTAIYWVHWNRIFLVVMALLFAIGSVGLASVYFGVRYYLIRSRRRTSVFGRRTRAEAVADLLVTGGGFFIVLSSWAYWAGELVSDTLGLISEADLLFRWVLSSAIAAWVPFLFIAILTRIAADFGNLRKSGSDFAQEAMMFSGNLFVIQAALMTGIYLMLLTYLESHVSILNEMLAILMLSYMVNVLFVFQKSTSGTKLKWRRESNSGME